VEGEGCQFYVYLTKVSVSRLYSIRWENDRGTVNWKDLEESVCGIIGYCHRGWPGRAEENHENLNSG
jgi:hypothetical protein